MKGEEIERLLEELRMQLVLIDQAIAALVKLIELRR